MIDYEVKIFNDVYDVAAPLCARKRFLSTQVMNYTDLPAASLFEMDNRIVQKRQSSTPVENFARVTYQLDVVAKTKDKCRTIYTAINDKLVSMNFTRISAQYIVYPDDTTIVRYVARYEAEIDSKGNIYRAS